MCSYNFPIYKCVPITTYVDHNERYQLFEPPHRILVLLVRLEHEALNMSPALLSLRSSSPGGIPDSRPAEMLEKTRRWFLDALPVRRVTLSQRGQRKQFHNKEWQTASFTTATPAVKAG